MTPNMGILDRSLRALVVAPVAIAMALLIGAGSVAGVILVIVAGIALAATTLGAGIAPAHAQANFEAQFDSALGTQLRTPRGHAACIGNGCHETKAGPAPRFETCDGCHRIGLAAERTSARDVLVDWYGRPLVLRRSSGLVTLADWDGSIRRHAPAGPRVPDLVPFPSAERDLGRRLADP